MLRVKNKFSNIRMGLTNLRMACCAYFQLFACANYRAMFFATISKANRFLFLSLSTMLLSFVVACSSSDKKTDSAEAGFKSAQEYDKAERYEEAIRRYQEVKNKFPYSKFATESELAIADCYFKQESFAESQVAYQSFKDLHPKHAQIDYVTYRLAMSYYKQLPETIDRDLSLSTNTILYFDETINQYPNSDYAKEAKEKKQEVLKMLAGKEDYIAEFYFIREKYDSALARYEGLLKKYPGLGYDAKAMSRAAVSAARLGELDKAKKYVRELGDKFPNSEDYKFAKDNAKQGVQ